MKNIFKKASENIGFLIWALFPGAITFYILQNNPTNPSKYFFGIITLLILIAYISSIFIDTDSKSNLHETFYKKEKESRALKANIYKKYKKDLDKISKQTIIIDKVKTSTNAFDPNDLNRSKYGGLPALKNMANWPRNSRGEYLTFIGQINFKEIHNSIDSIISKDLPKNGLILLFADTSEKEYKAIFSTPIDKTKIVKMPEQKVRIDYCFHDYSLFFTLPEINNETVSPKDVITNKKLFNEIDDESDYIRMSIHTDRILGYQSTIQKSDMRKEIVTKKNNINDWILLWEVTDDYREKLYTVTNGNLYVFIEEEKFKNQDFSDLRVAYDYS